MEEELLVVYC